MRSEQGREGWRVRGNDRCFGKDLGVGRASKPLFECGWRGSG